MADEEVVRLWAEILRAVAQGRHCTLREAARFLSDQLAQRAAELRGEQMPVQMQPGWPQDCSFCGGSLYNSILNAISKSEHHGLPTSAVCSHCLDGYTLLLSSTKGVLHSENADRCIAAAARSQCITHQSMVVVTCIVGRLHQRAVSILRPFQVPNFKTVEHHPIRIVICGSTRYRYANAIVHACRSVGLLTMLADSTQAESGRAWHVLRKTLALGDETYARAGTILVLNDFLYLPGLDCSAIFFSMRSPTDHGVEVIDADATEIVEPRLPKSLQ